MVPADYRSLGQYNTWRRVHRESAVIFSKTRVMYYVNPYVATTLAMCLVLLIALAATAYLAVFFNRRAKADLEAALAPLADAIDGSVDLDDAQITGRFERYPVYARMANASEGPGRVFQTDVVDAAGGVPWQYTSNPVTKSGDPWSVSYIGPDEVEDRVGPIIDRSASAFLDLNTERFRVEYLPEQGFVRLVRAMRTRRDIPETDVFTQQLHMLTAVASQNRAFMETYDAEVAAAEEQVKP